LLLQTTPPGPRYIELVREIWGRGFEVFVVGGTVRDVLAGIASNDVDLVTTMPTPRVFHLAKAMYGRPTKLEFGALRNGHLHLGGALGTADPFIDLSTFKHYLIGTPDAVFSDDFTFDLGNRDFACNSVYYDPINRILIDPCGRGIGDCQSKTLSVVASDDLRTREQLGKVVVRMFKFMIRGFTPTDEAAEYVHREGHALLSAMESRGRANYIRKQLLSKTGPEDSREDIVSKFRDSVQQTCSSHVCESLIDPIMELILS
jgi:tRNA nucleotidyltransferase/poly(A) polymerase